MFTQHATAVASIVFCFLTHCINATPTTALWPPYPNTVLYTWSTDPQCSTTALKIDCASAYTSLCARGRAAFTMSANVTVGDCTAFYWYDANNTIPSTAQCNAAYERILIASIGGALGYDANQKRTTDPLYAVYPSDGNANCFKAQGDSSPVLAPDALPGGGTLPTCPVSSSRRRRRAVLDKLERRQEVGLVGESDGVVGCAIEDGAWAITCTAVCLATVTAASWITGPFVATGWLACLGGCPITGTQVYNNCQKAQGHTGPDSHVSLNPFASLSDTNPKRSISRSSKMMMSMKSRRDGVQRDGVAAVGEESNNPCINIRQWNFQCPGVEAGLLGHYSCQEKINT